MIQWTTFYKLLGISEDVTDPTYFQLLGLKPNECTPELVALSLQERKKLLKRSIPGREYIPLEQKFEKDVLEPAAAVLSDSKKAKSYASKLKYSDAQEKRQRAAFEAKELLLKNSRAAVEELLNPDKTIDESDRSILALRLKKLGLRNRQIKDILDGIPISVKEEASPLVKELEYFSNTVELTIKGGLLSEDSEKGLLDLAEKLRIPQAKAQDTISDILKQKKAHRGEADVGILREAFRNRVRMMYPDGRATLVQRARLLTMARFDGLGEMQARTVLGECLNSMIEEEQATSGNSSGEKDQNLIDEKIIDKTPWLSRFLRENWQVLVGVLAVGLFIFIVAIFSGRDRDIIPPKQQPVASGTRQDSKTLSNQSSRVEVDVELTDLAKQLLLLVNQPDSLKVVVESADGNELSKALISLCHLLTESATTTNVRQAEMLYETLSRTAFDSKIQKLVMDPLIDHVKTTRDFDRSKRICGILSSALFLRDKPEFYTSSFRRLMRKDVSGPNVLASKSLRKFGSKCDQEWRESLTRHASDPLNDPVRLCYAVMEGGELNMYSEWADSSRVQAVVDQLVQVVVSGRSEDDSVKACNALQTSAVGDAGKGTGKALSQLGLCEILRRSSDIAMLKKVRDFLLLNLSVMPYDQLRSIDTNSPAGWQQLASAFEQKIRQGGGPGGMGQAMSSGGQFVPMANPLTQIYSIGGSNTDVLSDLALTMMACCDCADRFGTGKSSYGSEVLSLIHDSNRSATLIRDVGLPSWSLSSGVGNAPPQSMDMDQIKEDLYSNVLGLRYRAIDQLGRMKTGDALDILLEALKRGGSSLRFSTRILRVLLTFSDVRVPKELADILETSSSKTAFAIAEALRKGTGGYFSRGSTGMLHFTNTRKERKECAEWWRNHFAKGGRWTPTISAVSPTGGVSRGPTLTSPGGMGFGRGRSYAQPAQSMAKAPVAWEPDPTMTKLFGVVVYYGKESVEKLKEFRWDKKRSTVVKTSPIQSNKTQQSRTPGTGMMGPGLGMMGRRGSTGQRSPVVKIYVSSKMSQELVLAVDDMVSELQRVVRLHPESKKYAIKLDMIDLNRKARVLACNSALQKAAVGLDVTGELLEILVLLSDSNKEHKTTLDRLRREKEMEMISVRNVIHEMRLSCHHNLKLWEMLLGCEGLALKCEGNRKYALRCSR